MQRWLRGLALVLATVAPAGLLFGAGWQALSRAPVQHPTLGARPVTLPHPIPPPGPTGASSLGNTSPADSPTQAPAAPTPYPGTEGSPAGAPAATHAIAASGETRPGAPSAPPAAPVTWRSASRLQLPAIGLDTAVVPSPIVRLGDATTWSVPPHAVGHGEASGSIGEQGNAVLLGHLTSLNEGQVFAHLHRAPVGATLTLHALRTPDGAAEEARFVYRVVGVWLAPRDDISALVPTDAPVVTLVTCAGVWVPRIQDYSHRLVVRAELVAAADAPTLDTAHR